MYPPSSAGWLGGVRPDRARHSRPGRCRRRRRRRGCPARRRRPRSHRMCPRRASVRGAGHVGDLRDVIPSEPALTRRSLAQLSGSAPRHRSGGKTPAVRPSIETAKSRLSPDRTGTVPSLEPRASSVCPAGCWSPGQRQTDLPEHAAHEVAPSLRPRRRTGAGCRASGLLT